MNLTEITKSVGADRRRRRVGRGESSGSGKTCGRGHKGQHSRSGFSQRRLNEGGQMPSFRRMPKRGFNNANFRTEYAVVNVGDLNERFGDGAEVTLASLQQVGLIRNGTLPVKVLGDGTVSKKLTVQAHKFSASAEAKIGEAGGQVQKL